MGTTGGPRGSRIRIHLGAWESAHGHTDAPPSPAQERAAKRLRTAWYFLGDRATEGSQRLPVSHVEPKEGTELRW